MLVDDSASNLNLLESGGRLFRFGRFRGSNPSLSHPAPRGTKTDAWIVV